MSAQITNTSVAAIPIPVDLIRIGRRLQPLQNRIYYHWARIREIKAYSYSAAHSRQVKEGLLREAVSLFAIH
jgi:hypothetical protein